MTNTPNDEPVTLDSAMSHLLRRLKMDAPDAVGSVFAAWDELVGADTARHIQPIRLDEKVLYVEASDAAWATRSEEHTS